MHYMPGSRKNHSKGYSRIDAVFDPDKISMIRRYETRGEHTELIEVPWDEIKINFQSSSYDL